MTISGPSAIMLRSESVTRHATSKMRPAVTSNTVIWNKILVQYGKMFVESIQTLHFTNKLFNFKRAVTVTQCYWKWPINQACSTCTDLDQMLYLSFHGLIITKKKDMSIYSHLHVEPHKVVFGSRGPHTLIRSHSRHNESGICCNVKTKLNQIWFAENVHKPPKIHFKSILHLFLLTNTQSVKEIPADFYTIYKMKCMNKLVQWSSLLKCLIKHLHRVILRHLYHSLILTIKKKKHYVLNLMEIEITIPTCKDLYIHRTFLP
jgi:hypothetical protein